MIVFDLQCDPAGHRFEGWFSSSADFETQRERGLLTCPVCGSESVTKAVMAPAVAAKGNQRSERPASGNTLPVQAGQEAMPEKARELLQQLAHMQAEVLKSSQWVGRDFAEQARAMHYGEQDKKPIHGEVAAQEVRNLVDEGVEVAPLLFPVVPPEAQN